VLDRNLIVSPNKKQAWRVGPAGKSSAPTMRQNWKPQESGVTADLLVVPLLPKGLLDRRQSWHSASDTDGGKHWKQVARQSLRIWRCPRPGRATRFRLDVSRRKSFETAMAAHMEAGC